VSGTATLLAGKEILWWAEYPDFGGGACCGMKDDGYARRGEVYFHDRPA
jgi:hypothetical protein